MSYKVRTSDGLMIMTIPNVAAQKIINSSKGHFRPYKTDDSHAVTIFELDEDTVWTLHIGEIYLWKGTKMIPDHRNNWSE